MLPADQYRPGNYPPGPNWPSFGDPYLQRAFRGISAEANVNLQDKHERMRQLHKDRLDKQGFSSIPPPWQPPDPPSGGPPPRERQAALAGPDFQEALEWPDELYDPNPDNMRIVPRPADLPPEEPPQSALMNQVGELADQAAGSVGGAISAFAVEKGTELALAAGAAPGMVAAGAMAAGAALAPAAKEAVKAVGRMAYNVGEKAVDFYQHEGRWIRDQVADRWRDSTPLESLIRIPVLTAQDLIRHMEDSAKRRAVPIDPSTGDTELLPITRNIRDPPPWLSGAPEFVPRTRRSPPDIPTVPRSYGPSNPPPASNGASSSSSSSPPYRVYNNVDEWLENVPNRGALFEEIVKRPGWAEHFGITDGSGGHRGNSSEMLREKIQKMDVKELARVLIYLDTKAGHKHAEELKPDDDVEISNVKINRSRDMCFWKED